MKLKRYNEDVDTKRIEMLEYYFQLIQDKIKELLSSGQYKDIKQDDVEKFNDIIFTQHEYDVRKDLQTYIDDMFNKTVDEETVAKNILDKYYTMVYANEFNSDTVNDVENPLDESIMKFENFNEIEEGIRTYMVEYTSWFDFNDYDLDKIKKVMDNYNIATWVENNNGINNQPEVLCFITNENLVPKITEKLNTEFKTQWIRINEKSW